MSSLALRLLTWTWCLPQALLGYAGLAVARALGGDARPFRGAVLVRVPFMRWFGGVCLGPVILVPPEATPELVLHEWGHFRQHLVLGPLYLPLIGLPSVLHALWYRWRPRGSYFHFYTEAWADAWGGVYDRHGHPHRDWRRYLRGPLLVVTLVLIACALVSVGLPPLPAAPTR